VSRRRGRELAMQMLFQEEMGPADPGEVRELFWCTREVPSQVRMFAEEIFSRAVEDRAQIDDWIGRFLRNWRLQRINPVDRNILRMAVAEFLLGRTPRTIVIDEAVEIAREFGSDKSPDFVNGVLDAILAEVERKVL
jgi:transcription antitermination protein NusB